ncbi:MAG: carbohydrate binding family 9 domain-containing protein [Acidobacteriota bacterium]
MKNTQKRRLRLPVLALALFAGAALLPAALAAQQIRAVRVEAGPRIDGRLDDPVWQQAPVIDGFRMVEPRPGENPTERTEARIVYDGHSLYVGVHCYDSEPGRISANNMAHDSGSGSGGSYMGWGQGYGGAATASDDIVRVLLDPFQDKRNAYIFFVNARGARGEGLCYAGSSSLNWDGIWEAASSRLEDGWSTEIRIPFKTISFRPGLETWGLNIERTVARKMEVIRLSGTTLDANFDNPNEAAALQGISGVKQGKGITFRPYGLASATKVNAVSSKYDSAFDGGFDLYKSFTPNLVGVVSYNMDFAETEVDERRINLTRFPMYFPEKRMFFLEGSENFSFSSSVSFTPFFSRTVGLYNGNQVPVLWGTKLYGKIGNTNLTFLDVQTKDTSLTDSSTGGSIDLPGRNLLAARITQNIFAQSKVGLIFTNGSQTGEKNSLLGMDFNYSSSKFLGDKNLMLAAWGVYNWNETEEGRHHGFGFRANYPNDLWNIQSTYAYYGEALNPGLGYMMRQGIQTGWIRAGFQPRPKGGFLGRFVRQFFFDVSADYYWDLTGHLETSTLSASPLSFRTQSGESFSFEVQDNHDNLPFDWEVSEGIFLPAGPYDYTSFRLNASSASHRHVVLSGGWNFGEYYSGHYDDVDASLTLKVKGYASLAFSANLVRGRMPMGDFSENVYQVKADIFLSPRLGLMNYVQYDTMSDNLGWSARLRWEISPGNEVYLVYNKSWDRVWDPRSRFVPVGDRGVLKISLSIRP